MLSSAVQQSESAIDIHPLFFGFPSHLGHLRTLTGVPCAISRFSSYLVYILLLLSLLSR